LRKRGTDIQLLALTFLKALVKEYGRQPRTFTVRGLQENNKLDARLVTVLTQSSWEGNIMQLKVFVRSLVVLPYDKLMNAEEHMQVTAMITNVAEGREFSLKASMDLVRQAIVSRAIDACGGNIRKAGQLLGMTESAIHRRKATLLLIVTYLSFDFFSADLLEFSLSFL
jgi:DNA-binding NtrC family response regulator